MNYYRWFFLILTSVYFGDAASMSQFKLTSSAFADHGKLSQQFTCDGANISPPLSWAGAPEMTKSYVLIMTDYDAIYSRRMYMQHWSVYNLPASITELTMAEHSLTSGINSYDVTTYRGPCPPAGTTHRYSFQLYALDVEHLTLTNSPPTANELVQAMQGHLVDQTVLTGVYTRPI